MQSSVNRTLSDPGNIVLLLIGILTIILMLHGKTLILIPRYRGVEVHSKDSGEQWALDDKVHFGKLDNVKLYNNPKDNPEWQPPCLPNEDPDYEAKQQKKIEAKVDPGMQQLIETIEDEFKNATKDLSNEKEKIGTTNS